MKKKIIEVLEGGRVRLEDGTTKRLRIRTLTPRECFRLQDVSDSDINKIQAAGISKTQQYKLAGNSITVRVLTNIFEQMFYPRWQAAPEETPKKVSRPKKTKKEEETLTLF